MRRPPCSRTRWLEVLITGLALLCSVASADAESLAVIIHKANPITSLSATTVAQMYRGETLHWQEGERIKLVNREISAETRKTFYFRLLNAKPDQVFYRHATPIPVQSVIQRSDEAVVRFVSTIEGAIGYVGLSELQDIDHSQIKVILVVEDR